MSLLFFCVLFREIQKHYIIFVMPLKKLLRLQYNYPRPVPPKSGPSLGLCVYSLPQSLYILLCECLFPCWTPTVACISCVIVCFHAGLPQSLYTIVLVLDPPTELVYPLV